MAPAAVFLRRAAPPGTGIIAGGPDGAPVFETLGNAGTWWRSRSAPPTPTNMVFAPPSTRSSTRNSPPLGSCGGGRNIKVSTLQSRRREGGEAEATSE